MKSIEQIKNRIDTLSSLIPEGVKPDGADVNSIASAIKMLQWVIDKDKNGNNNNFEKILSLTLEDMAKEFVFKMRGYPMESLYTYLSLNGDAHSTPLKAVESNIEFLKSKTLLTDLGAKDRWRLEEIRINNEKQKL